MCAHYCACVLILPYASSYHYMWVLILLYVTCVYITRMLTYVDVCSRMVSEVVDKRDREVCLKEANLSRAQIGRAQIGRTHIEV
jgi:hypothetical protein